MQIRIKPAAGLTIKKPDGTVLAAEGEMVTFTVTSPDSKTASGNGVLDYVVSLATATASDFNNAFGYQALQSVSGASFSNCNAFGVDAGKNNQASNLTAFGHRALNNNTTGLSNSAFGREALSVNQDASNFTTFTNCTGLGYQAAVSGNHQVQLGNASTTTYVYGTLQNRSDERDKADIRDTQLGISSWACARLMVVGTCAMIISRSTRFK